PVHRDELGEVFAMMVGMGFFIKKQQFYQMTLPSGLTAERVRAAVVEFAETEDEDYELYVEHLVTTMPFSEAVALQNRLRTIDEFRRKNGEPNRTSGNDLLPTWKLDMQEAAEAAEFLAFPPFRPKS